MLYIDTVIFYHHAVVMWYCIEFGAFKIFCLVHKMQDCPKALNFNKNLQQEIKTKITVNHFTGNNLRKKLQHHNHKV